MLKIKIMRDYARSLGWEHWTNAVGLRFDEPRRVARIKNQRDRWVSVAASWGATFAVSGPPVRQGVGAMLVDTTALSDKRRAVVPTSMPVGGGGPLTPLKWLPSWPRPTSGCEGGRRRRSLFAGSHSRPRGF